MIPFHCIGGIDKFSDASRKLEVFRKLFPIVLPGLNDNGILFSPPEYAVVQKITEQEAAVQLESILQGNKVSA